jgi:DNA-binding CsgD family transcriptional regulator
MVRGEPGIGKSTLLDLAASRLGVEWARVRITGRALGTERAYEAARSLLRRLAAADVIDAPSLFEHSAQAFTELAARGPVVLLIDDLHWIDDGSVELLDYFWSEFADVAVLWLVAFREPELEARPVVQRLVHRMERERASEAMAVPRLSLAAVREMCAAASAADRPPPPGLAERIYERSRGNPLVVDALLRTPTSATTADAGPAPIPSYVRDVFVGQLGDLQAAERDRLLLAAVLDAPLAEHEVQPVMSSLGHPPPVADAARRVLLGRRLLNAGESGAITIAHPVIGEIALDVYSGQACRRLCAAVFAVLQGRLNAFDAARMVEAAGDAIDPQVAIDVLTTAADQVYGLESAELAVRWQTAAVGHAERLPEPARSATLGRVLVGLVAHLDGDPSQALTFAERAVEVASAAGCWAVAADAALAAARAHWVSGHPESQRASLRRAIELSDHGDSATRLRAREGMLHQSVVAEMPDAEMLAEAAEFRSLAEAAGESERAVGLDVLLHLRHIDRFDRSDWARYRAVCDESRRGGWKGWERSRTMVLDAAVLDGDWATVEELATDTGLPVWRRFLARFEVAFVRGRWETAQRIVDSAGSLGRHPGGVSAMEWMAVHTGRALGPVAPIRSGVPESAVVPEVVRAYGRMLRGEALELPELVGQERHITMQEMRVRPALAEVLLAAGRMGEFQRVVDRLAAMSLPGNRSEAAMQRLEALAVAQAGDVADARRRLLIASASFAALGMTFDSARCELDAVLIRTGQPTDGDASRLVDLASRFDEIGAAPWAARARAAIRESGVPAGPRTPLTRRELEIARLVAQGKSNALIAAELFVSVRTVTSHLDHAYTKLGIGSRAALGVYVRELDRNT